MQIGERLIGQNLEAAAECAAPFAIEIREEPFLDICVYVGVDIHYEVSQAECFHEIFEFLAQSVGKENRRLYLAFSQA